MRYIYNFNTNFSDGNQNMRDTLGGKGANLAELSNMGLPVPAGFTITPEASKFFISDSFDSVDKFNFNVQFNESLKTLEEKTNTFLSSEKKPCLISVRSGAKHSMPGMMDTVLNLGLNDSSIANLIKETGNSFFAYDCYRRFIQTYGIVVLGLSSELFEERLECFDTPTSEDLKNICYDFKKIIKDNGKDIPDSGHSQLREAIKAVYLSWFSPKAISYRHLHDIPESIGTAVTIQRMVYGNRNNNSCTGVLFSKDCLTGSNIITGEYLTKAQGDDIVSGLKTPNPLSLQSSKDLAINLGYSEEDRVSILESLEEKNAEIFKELVDISKKLEKHFKEVQDIEFTVDDGVLWILQARTAKRTKKANSVIQKSLFIEGIISEEELLERTKRYKLESIKKFDFSGDIKSLAIGLAASSGVTSGQIVFTPKDAISKLFPEMILIREQTDTSDLDGIVASNGTLTANGGTTSHAAVVCREINKTCIVGARIEIDLVTKKVQIGDKTLSEGDWLSLDGDTGEIFYGKLDII